jgi:hypothetical protein
MEECVILITAESLVSQVQAEGLPNDFEPGDFPYRVILADIRHNYTNYESLLAELPQECQLCQWSEEGVECISRTMAHDLLKWEANGAAEGLYDEWLERRR